MTFLLLLLTASLQGTVRDANQKPLPAVTVVLEQDGAANARTARTDEKGNYRFNSIPFGVYRLRAEGISQTVTFDSEQTRTLDLTMEPAFFDEPQFTIAGVTDNTYRGGHGSGNVLRSSEALAKSTAALGGQSNESTSGQNTESNYKIAMTLVAESKYQEAIPYLERSLKADGRNADAFRLLGDADEHLGKSLDAVHAYQQALQLDPSEINTFELGAELLTHLAPDAAIEVFSKGNRLFPLSTRIILGLAVSLYSRGFYDQAAQRFFEACDLNPATPEPYLFLGKVQRSEITGLDGFNVRMHRFVQLQPANAWANYYYALTIRDSAETAKPFLEKAIKLNPRFAEAYVQLGIIAAAQKDSSAAITYFRQASTLDPGLEEPHYRLAQIYKVLGDSPNAAQELRLYDETSKRNAADAERQRSETQRFVMALRKQPR